MTYTQSREGNVHVRCELRFRVEEKEEKAFQKERLTRIKRQENTKCVGGGGNKLWQER